jgi:CheY-like chemotaxis protein
MATQLRTDRLRVQTAENGGPVSVEENRFSLIITDCHMPKMDGYTLAGRHASSRLMTGVPTLRSSWTADALAGSWRKLCLSWHGRLSDQTDFAGRTGDDAEMVAKHFPGGGGHK